MEAVDNGKTEMGIFAQAIHSAAEFIGFTDLTLLFFVILLIGYPLALIPRKYFQHVPANVQHLAYTVLALAMSYCIFGMQTIHFIITIGVNYLLLASIGGTQACVAISFIYNMIYFLVGTMSVADGTHSIAWDTPHCVMVLKVMGVAFDLYDGQKPKESLSAEQKVHFITKAPTLLEMSGFCLFFGGFLAGPQFSIRLYLDYTSNTLMPAAERDNPSNVFPAIRQFCFGVFYLCLGLFLNLQFPDLYFLSEDFTTKGLLYKLVIVFIWGNAYRMRYQSIWLFTEGVCIMSGIAYNGSDEKGAAKWDGVANVKIYDLETATTFRTLVASYNINTNKWAGRCIYKRCKFLGNRQLSQFVTLMFLALWHGVYIGYFHCFLCELFCITFEEQWSKVWRKLGLSFLWDNPVLSVLMSIFCNFFIMTSFAYSLISFRLCYWALFTEVYTSMYYVGHIWYLGWMLLFPFVIKPMLGREKSSDKMTAEEKSK